MAAAPLLDGSMAEALDCRRDRFNAIVATARRARPQFDTAIFADQLRGPVAAVVEACASQTPGSGPSVLAALFEPVVELVGQRRLGGGTHDALLAALPELAPALVESPRQVFASLANATFHLQRSAIPVSPWLRRVVRASHAGDVGTLLTAGQVAAWAVGLAHYRSSALATAATLPGDALAAALDAPDTLDVEATVTALRRDRWARPDGTRVPSNVVAHAVGGFRGFGGPFLAPPAVAVDGDRLVVTSGAGAWMLHADAFGATLTRTELDGATTTAGDTNPTLPPGLVASAVRTVGDTTALTRTTSYQVLVVAGVP